MRLTSPPLAAVSPIRALALAAAAVLVAIPASSSPSLEASPDAAAPSAAPENVAFVIVTPARLSHEFERLARARRREGIATEVVTLEAIRVAVPSARDDAERVRGYLSAAHATRGLRWVLLGGADGVVPLRRASLLTALGPIELPTDQYYACLDGDWNADGDDRWGESATPSGPGDAADLVPELGVGRAPVTTVADARDFVRRTLAVTNRDARPPTALLAADWLDLGGPGGLDLARFAERAAEDLAADGGWRVTRLYDNSAAWPGSTQETPSTLVASLDDGPDLALILGLGGRGVISAGPDGGPYVTGADVSGLANAPRYTHVITVSACVNQPDAPEAIGASLMRASRGGAASVVGTVDLQFLGLAEAMIGLYVERLLATPRPAFGDAMREAIVASALSGSDDSRLTTQGTLLLGDPTLRLPQAPAVAVAAPARSPSSRGRLADVDAAVVATDADVVMPGPLLTLPRRDLDRAPGGSRSSREGPASHGSSAAVRVPSLALAVRGSSASGPVRLAFTVSDVAGRTRLSIYDLGGREVARLVDGDLRAGRSEVVWDGYDRNGRRAAAGLYFARLSVAGRAAVQRLVVAR